MATGLMTVWLCSICWEVNCSKVCTYTFFISTNQIVKLIYHLSQL